MLWAVGYVAQHSSKQHLWPRAGQNDCMTAPMLQAVSYGHFMPLCADTLHAHTAQQAQT